MDLSKWNRKEYYGAYVMVLVVICCLIGMLISRGKSGSYSTFAKPLFEHALPADTILLTQSEDSGRQDSKAYRFACLVLQSTLSKEELETFYRDISYPPYKEGQEVTLNVYPVEGDSIEVVKSSKAYQEGAGELWYIYLYSTDR